MHLAPSFFPLSMYPSTVVLDLVYNGPQRNGARSLGTFWFDAFCEFQHLRLELVLDILVHEDARGRTAALAHVDEKADVCAKRRLFQIRVLADDQWRLAAQFKRDLLQVVSPAAWTILCPTPLLP